MNSSFVSTDPFRPECTWRIRRQKGEHPPRRASHEDTPFHVVAVEAFTSIRELLYDALG